MKRSPPKTKTCVKMEAAHFPRHKYIDYNELDLSQGLHVHGDGATWNNGQKDPTRPCYGGYGWVAVHNGTEIGRGSGGAIGTTISRMELLALIDGLTWVEAHFLPKTHVIAISDSQYVIRSATEYIRGWLERGWKNNAGKDTPNKDLWKRLVKLSNASNLLSFGSKLDVSFSWCPGHAGHQWNELCDEIAGAERDRLIHGSKK